MTFFNSRAAETDRKHVDDMSNIVVNIFKNNKQNMEYHDHTGCDKCIKITNKPLFDLVVLEYP